MKKLLLSHIHFPIGVDLFLTERARISFSDNRFIVPGYYPSRLLSVYGRGVRNTIFVQYRANVRKVT